MGSFSTHTQPKTLFTHTSENCYKDEKEVADQHPQMSLFEELSVSLRKLLAHDNNIPIITSPEPDEATSEATTPNLSVKSNNFMETFYQIQAWFHPFCRVSLALYLSVCLPLIYSFGPGLMKLRFYEASVSGIGDQVV